MIDDFEIHRMVLDCNAANVPKYVSGEPVWIRVPLNSTGRVESVKLRWGNGSVPWMPMHQIGRAADFSVQTFKTGASTFVTNGTSTGPAEIIPVGAEADELLLQLDQRIAGVDYYGLQEIEVTGATVSLPSASVPGAGSSRLDKAHAISFATDGAVATSWASGLEEQARITLPMAPGTAVNRIRLNWNCETILESGRLGPAATYSIQARDETTGEYNDVPFVRSTRDAGGAETVALGTVSAPISITTDQVAIILTSRDPAVDYYSLREVTLWNGQAPVLIRQPTSLNNLGPAVFPVAQALDGDVATQWASSSQGAVIAISVCGSNFKFDDLLIVGFGTKAGTECFPMTVGPHQYVDRPFAGNVLVENCRFAAPATNNRDGLTALSVRGIPSVALTNAVIRRCRVTDVRPYFTYSQGMSATHIESCFVSNCLRAVYFEPERANIDSVGPVLVRSNQFVDVDSGVYFNFHADSMFDSITCLDNEIVLSGILPFQWGIGGCDVCFGGPSGSITNFTAVNNIVRYADWGSRPPQLLDGGLHYSDIHHAVFANNVIALGTSGAIRVRGCPAGMTPAIPPIEDCDHYDPGPLPPPTPIPCLDELRPGYRRAWLNNRTILGDLIQVRTFKDGVELPAAQQQWVD